MKNIGFIILIVLTGCSMVDLVPSSVIEGKVSIGPLCGNIPVGESGLSKDGNPCGLSNQAMDEIYGKYSVVLKTNKDIIVAQKKLDRTGSFSFQVTEGAYRLAVDSQVTGLLSVSQKEQLQKTISISKNANQSVIFTIDTGIR
jgi:hypothetical protein